MAPKEHKPSFFKRALHKLPGKEKTGSRPVTPVISESSSGPSNLPGDTNAAAMPFTAQEMTLGLGIINSAHLGFMAVGGPAHQTVPAEMEVLSNVVKPELDKAKVEVDSLGDPPSFIAVLEKVGNFTKIFEAVIEIHPVIKVVVKVMRSTLGLFTEQAKNDVNLQNLLKTMEDVFTFVHSAKPLGDASKPQKKTLYLLLRQTLECVTVIREYTTSHSKNFMLRTLQNVMSDMSTQFVNYTIILSDLKRDFIQQTNVVMAMSVLHMSSDLEAIRSDIQDLNMKTDLNDIPYAEGASYQPEKGCLPGTRHDIIQEIIDWVFSADGESTARLFWLNGVAGSGKSSISHTIAEQMKQLGRLGSSFYFDRADQARRTPGNIFSTIARDLADFDLLWKQALHKVVKDDRALRTTQSIDQQFKKFILAPTKLFTPIGPVVIIIDALDESGDSLSRQGLLQILATQAHNLPSNFRILVTSRTEDDVYTSLSSKDFILFKPMDRIDSTSTNADIEAFVEHKLSQMAPKFNRRWPENAWLSQLVEKADGSFQWAYAACQTILNDHGSGLLPTERMEHLLASGSGLEGLYTEILHQAYPNPKPNLYSRFSEVFGRILAAKEPMTLSTLCEMHKADDLEFEDVVAFIIKPLGPLLSGVTDPTIPLRPLHTSFRDFLEDQKHAGQFFILTTSYEAVMAHSCFCIMEEPDTGLQFNIWKLETSYLPNDKVPETDFRKKVITPHLSYAVRFWAEHTQASIANQEIIAELANFMEVQFLYWLEVLSFRKSLSTAVNAMHLLGIEPRIKQDPALQHCITDATQFLAAFAAPISHSTPHIYISALSFSPSTSWIDKKIEAQYHRIVTVEHGQKAHWNAALNVLQGHKSAVMSVAFSPDGKRIASGSADHTIRVWSAETGAAVAGPFEGHTQEINSITFSPDGKKIASGSSDHTICVWNAETGAVVAGPFEGHTWGITSVAFSPDGQKIASGSNDGKIHVWNAETGTVVAGPFEGHTARIWSVAFSPDGQKIASGSEDKTICVWNAETGTVVAGPFEGHTARIWSVAFSPGGQKIASGSDDHTVCVWDAETGAIMAGPFKGHTGGINSVAFSPDGQKIASGSDDQTIHVWNAETGAIVAGPFQGHTSRIWSVAFSPDGQKIASGFDDCTICVWNAETSAGVAGSFEGHTKGINSVAYSPDGQTIASGSDDHTIHVWNAVTGALVAGPFKGHTAMIWSVVFSPDGQRIASGSADHTICVWDAKTGAVVAGPFEGHTDEINSITFSPDGQKIASGSNDCTIHVWNAETGAVLAGPFKGHTHKIWSVAFSPDGQKITSGSDDKTIYVWNAETCAIIAGPFQGHTEEIGSVAFSPDGQMIASGSDDCTICVWNAETGAIVAGPFEGHTDYVRSVAFSPDGQRIASGSEDKTICVWNAETGAIVAGPFKGHTDYVRSVAFSPDGQQIVSGSDDCTIHIWHSTETSLADSSYWPSSAKDTLKDGWIVGQNDEYLLWIPPVHRHLLCHGMDSHIIGKDATKLNFSNWAHGQTWTQCRKSIIV